VKARAITSLALPAVLATAGLVGTAEAAYASLGPDPAASAKHGQQIQPIGDVTFTPGSQAHCPPFGNVTVTDYGHCCTPVGNITIPDYGYCCTPVGNVTVADYGYCCTPVGNVTVADYGYCCTPVGNITIPDYGYCRDDDHHDHRPHRPHHASLELHS
jgi:hypothetical protein